MRLRNKCGESGAILVLTIVLVLIFLFFGFLILDSLRVEKVARALQRTADAMALAGALKLDPGGTDPRVAWKNAKRAAVGYLRLNPIYAAEDLVPSGANVLCCTGSTEAAGGGACDSDVTCICKCGGGSPSEACPSTCSLLAQDAGEQADSSYAPLQYTYALGRLSVTIERGWWSAATNVYYPLDRWVLSNGELTDNGNTDDNAKCVAARFIGESPNPCPEDPVGSGTGQEVWKFANSCRVTITLRNVSTFLGSVPYINTGNTAEITKEAFAKPDWS